MSITASAKSFYPDLSRYQNPVSFGVKDPQGVEGITLRQLDASAKKYVLPK